MFIHYTTEAHAARIVAAMVLGLSATIVDAVYAVAVGGVAVPTVQYGGGRGVIGQKGRGVAVLFTAAEAPDTICPEEVIWHRDTPLTLTDAAIISADEADSLLDGSAGIVDPLDLP